MCDRKDIGCIIILILTVFLTHLFTVNWEQPAMFEHVADAAVPIPNLSAKDMFYAKTMGYGPFHYIILTRFSPGWKGDLQTCPDVKALTGARIIAFRRIAAVMDGLLMLSLFLFCRYVLCWSAVWSLLPALSSTLLPVTLFYSHTSNMDIPYVAWLMTALLFAGLAYKLEQTHRKTSLLLNLLAGMFLAFSFCTKEQVYGICVLPAFYYVWIRWKEHEGRKYRLFFAFRPLLLWGITFVLSTVLIYCGTVGWDGACNHWKMISTEGKDNFEAVDSSLAGRLTLVLHFVKHMGVVLDFPGILFLVFLVSLGSVLHHHKFPDGERNKQLGLFVFFAFLSQFFLYYQVVLRTEVRWNIPTAILAVIVLFHLARLIAQDHPRLIRAAVSVFLLLQTAVAIQFLYNLKNSPLTRLQADLPQLNGQKLTAVTASFGHFYDIEGNDYTRRKAVRSWHQMTFGLPNEYMQEIICDSFSAFWLDANALLLRDTEADTDAVRKEFSAVFSPANRIDYNVKEILPTMLPLKPVQLTILPRTAPWQGDFKRSAFAGYTLDQQLMVLSFLLEQQPSATQEKLALLGSILTTYIEPQVLTCHISPAALFAAHEAYAAAGRETDRQQLHSFILRAIPDAPDYIRR